MAASQRTRLTEEEKAAKREYNRQYRVTPKGAAGFAWNRLTSRAGAKYNHRQCYANVEVRISRADFMAWAIPAYEAWFREHPGETASVDRIQPDGHYEAGNLRLIEVQENRSRRRSVNDDAPEGTKWCAVCKRYRPFELFFSHAGQPNGLSGWCRFCTVNKQAGGAKDVERERETIRARRRTPEGAAVRAWSRLHEMGPEKAPIARAEFIAWALPEYERWFHANPGQVPTLKRIDPDRVYQIGNLCLVSQEDCKLGINRDAPAGTKRCGHCRQFLPLTDFYALSSGKHSGYCRTCARESRRVKYHRDANARGEELQGK